MVAKSAVYWPFAGLVAGSMLLRWITPATARLESSDLRRTAA
jgi:hypothetical protein